MISEFEQRLANVLGGRLPAPFTGHAHVAPAPSDGDDPTVAVRVAEAAALESGMGGEAQQTVPGAPVPRRVVGLACVVELAVLPASAGGRAQVMAGADAALYILDAPEFRNGSAFAGGAPDPGFLIRSMRFRDIITSPRLLASGDAAESTVLRFDAEGWFWPVGTPGEAGREIESVRIRGALSPMELHASARIVAGGDPVDLTLLVRDIIKPAGGTPGTFSSLALRLVGPGGGDGAGTLQGAGGGVLLVELEDGEAQFTYIPPDEEARDQLVISLDDGEDGIGMELGRFTLKVEAAS